MKKVFPLILGLVLLGGGFLLGLKITPPTDKTSLAPSETPSTTGPGAKAETKFELRRATVIIYNKDQDTLKVRYEDGELEEKIFNNLSGVEIWASKSENASELPSQADWNLIIPGAKVTTSVEKATERLSSLLVHL